MKRVFLFNFFGGVLDRGIPAYSQDISTCMRRVGLQVIELRCPPWLRRCPRPLLNVLFVLFEQLLAPLLSLLRSCSVTVYPYNSAGIIDALLGRSVLIVHDLISNHRQNTRLAARYIRVTQAVHRHMRRPICAASQHTYAQLRRLRSLQGCPIWLWTNPFYAFESTLRHTVVEPRPAGRPLRVLLCSGMGHNKDYAGAMKLFRKTPALAEAELHVLGFGQDAHLAVRRISRLPASIRDRIRILPRLTLEEVVAEYAMADLVWVHSRKEGFGRSVLEGLLAGKPVLASNIAAFRELARPGVHLYRRETFGAALEQALKAPQVALLSSAAYHAPLEHAVEALLMGGSPAVATDQDGSASPAFAANSYATGAADSI